MVVGAFPIAKLGLMAIKHIAKPISSLLKRTAQKNPAFKKLVVAPPARCKYIFRYSPRIDIMAFISSIQHYLCALEDVDAGTGTTAFYSASKRRYDHYNGRRPAGRDVYILNWRSVNCWGVFQV